MEYLWRKDKPGAAHIWLGVDTACRMWSTGGLQHNRRGGWNWGAVRPMGTRICQMCANNFDAANPDADIVLEVLDSLRDKQVPWDGRIALATRDGWTEWRQRPGVLGPVWERERTVA